MLNKKIIELYKSKRELTLLQGTYLIITIISLVVAGLLALVNQPTGHSVLIITLIAAIALVGNTVMWALIRLFAEYLLNREEYLKEILKKEMRKENSKNK